MIRLLNFVLVIGALVAGAVWLVDRPGDLHITWIGWDIHMSVPVFLLGLVVLFFLITLPLRFIKTVIEVPAAVTETVTEAIAEVRDIKAENQNASGLLAMTQGIASLKAQDVMGAVPQLQKAASTLADECLTEVLLGEAAELAGDEDATRQQYEMLLQKPETELAALHGLTMQAIRQDDNERAYELASKAYVQRPDLRWVTKALFMAQVALNKFEEALETLESSHKYSSISEARYLRLKVTVLCALADKAMQLKDTVKAAELADKAHAADPDFPPAAVRAAWYQKANGNDKKAVSALIKVWRNKPHPDVYKAYLSLFPDENEYMLVQRGEQIAAVNKKHPESHLFVAETALKAKIWGQVRKELDLFLAERETTQKAARLMAEFEEGANGDTAAALRWFRDSEKCQPDAVWRCTKCNLEPGEWFAICPECASLASYMWTEREGALVETQEALVEEETQG